MIEDVLLLGPDGLADLRELMSEVNLSHDYAAKKDIKTFNKCLFPTVVARQSPSRFSLQ